MDLFVNIATQKLNSDSIRGISISAPCFVQGDSVPLTITFTKDGVAQDYNGYALAVSLSGGVAGSGDGKPTGTAGGPTPIALQTSWSWSSLNNRFSGTLNLNTTEFRDLLGALDKGTSVLEISASAPSGAVESYQYSARIFAEVHEAAGGTTAPTPEEDFPTRAEALALFARLVGLDGQCIVLVSPDGTRRRTIGVNNDGSAKDDIT